MTHQHDPKAPFNPQIYREAMGPGYGVALFKEQDELTGHSVALLRERSLTVKRSLSPLSPRRRWLLPLRHSVLVRLDQLLERSRHITQAQLSNLEDAAPVPKCC